MKKKTNKKIKNTFYTEVHLHKVNQLPFCPVSCLILLIIIISIVFKFISVPKYFLLWTWLINFSLVPFTSTPRGDFIPWRVGYGK